MSHPRARVPLWRRLLRLSWMSLAIAIVVVAVAITALRLAVALTPEYRAHIEQAVGEAIGQSLELGELRIEWRGRDLQLVLRDVRVAPETVGGGLAADELRVHLDVWRSLREREVRSATIELVGLDITVQRNLQGRYQLVGVGVEGQRDQAVEALETLMMQPVRLRLVDGRVRILDLRERQTRYVEQVELRVTPLADGGRQLAGRVDLPDAWGRDLAFILEWGRDGMRPFRDGPVEAYAQVRDLRSDAVSELFGAADGSVIAAGDGNYRLWATLERGLPGVAGSDNVPASAGNLRVKADHGALDLPKLFRYSIPFRSFDMEARWRSDTEGWRFDAEEVSVDNADGDVVSRFTIASRQGEPLFIDLRAHMRGRSGNAVNTSRYLPAPIMPEALVGWLDRSIVDGTASIADVIFHGHATDFPFTGGQGHFEVRAQTQDMTLAYWPDWPMLESVDGNLHFIGKRMHITADHGDVGGARLLRAEATIPALGQSPLAISGEFRGGGGAFLDFLRNMPLTDDGLGATLDALALDGSHLLSLDLEIPFDGTPLDIHGNVELEDGRLSMRDRPLVLETLNGAIEFDRYGLRAPRITGEFHGVPVLLSADTRETERGRLTRLRADGRAIPLAPLHAQAPGAAFLDGTARVSLTADLPGFTGDMPSEYPAEILVESDLVGVSNSMPAPLGKSADEDLPLTVRFGVGRQVGPIHVRYGSRASLVLGLAANGVGVERVGVRFGEGDVELPSEPGLEVVGQAPVLDPVEWLRWSPPGPEGNGARGDPLTLRRLDLAVDLLRLQGLELPDVVVAGSRNGDWDLSLDGATVAGRLQVPVDMSTGILRADLRYLHVPGLPEGFDEIGDGETLTGDLTPADMPGLDIEIDELTFNELALGRLRIHGFLEPSGDYLLSGNTLNGAEQRIDIEGRWRAAGRTEASLSMRSEDVGAALSAYGYEDAMRRGRGRLSADLSWPGGPADFSMASVGGDLKLSLRDGQLVQVEPGAGRLFGLVSVALLPRRLALNFSDVFEEGFAFDRLKADFRLADGIASPRELYMEGPSARISAEGDVNLVEGTYDQTVTVMPKASATLPIIGGLLGGPPGAAALFIAQRFLSGGLDDVARLRYRITGPLDDPEISRVGRALTPPEGDPQEPEPSPMGPE